MKNSACGIMLVLGMLVLAGVQSVDANAARFGYYWHDRSLPYSNAFSYSFDIAVYPNGIFTDSSIHSWVYVTSQNKHVVHEGVPYSVEAILQYGYFTDNERSVKRLWITDFSDPNRFVTWWIDDDADGNDYWEISTLQSSGYLFRQSDPEGNELWFLRIRIQTVLVSESAMHEKTVWENMISLFNSEDKKWHVKVKNRFVLNASSAVVRQSTYETGSGIWSSILETEGNEAGAPDYGFPPVKKIVVMNRSICVVDKYKIRQTKTSRLDKSTNIWVDPGDDYTVYVRSSPIFLEFSAGSE